MLEFIAINLFRIIFVIIGGYFIGSALVRLEKKHWFLVGLNIMLAVWNTGWLIKTIA